MPFSNCPHRNIIVETRGSRTFHEGEVFDDLHEVCVCLDCAETLTDAEAYAAVREIELNGEGSERERSIS